MMPLVTFNAGLLLGMPIGAWIIVIVAVRDHNGGNNGTDHHHS